MAVCNNNIINIKVGSGVVLNCVYQDSSGKGLSLKDMSIQVDFRDPKTGNLLATGHTANLSIIITDEITGEYTINVGSSLGWPVGQMPVDILYLHGGITQHTEDFILDFTPSRTQTKVASPTASTVLG